MRDCSLFFEVEEFISEKMITVRNEKIISDHDMAELYDVDISDIRKTVGRNKLRFPEDFMFIPDKKEKELFFPDKDVKYLFTWSGVFMLAGLLKSDKAIKTYMQLLDVFIGQMPGKGFEILEDIMKKE